MTGGRYRLPGSLGGEVRHELERLGPGSASTSLIELAAVWSSAVGPAIAANAWPARQTRDGTLVVHVASSAWAQELTQLEPTIREQLGPVAPPRIRFAVGPLPEVGHDSTPSSKRFADPPTASEHERARTLAQGIENAGLRAAVSQAAALSLAQSRGAGPDRRV